MFSQNTNKRKKGSMFSVWLRHDSENSHLNQMDKSSKSRPDSTNSRENTATQNMT